MLVACTTLLEISFRGSYVDKPLDFDSLRIPSELLFDQNTFETSHKVFITRVLIVVRQEAKHIDNSVVVPELELAMKHDI